MLERTLKRTWHADLVAHPQTHAWVLNLYRAGERHPQTVTDYFPHAHAPSADLAEAMKRHEKDEERHTKMYARAIESLGEPVVDLEGFDVFNEVIRDRTRACFAVLESDDADTRREKVAHFLAHAHFLEDRIARSLRFHLDACNKHGSEHVAAVVAAVLADEERHVEYSARAVGDLLTRRSAQEVLDVHRRGEARANLAFSRRQVRACLRRFRPLVPGAHRSVYALAAWVMREAEAHV